MSSVVPRIAVRLIGVGVVLAVVFGLAGCAGNEKRQAAIQRRNAAIRAQQEALILQQQNQPVVYMRGLVQRPIIPWRENMTLAEALLEAGYSSTLNPRGIRVTRQGQTYPVDVRALLRGQDNPVMEPGDLVEVFR